MPAETLPQGTSRDDIVRISLAREGQVSTNLGNGVAIPHARCQGLRRPIVVFGRSSDGIAFSPESAAPESAELVHLVFLLVTPSERPETQLALLRQLAGICQEPSTRESLQHAASAGAVLSILDSRSREAA
jgi:PTS system fructose-specific IIC component